MTTINMQEQIGMLVELQALDGRIFEKKGILDGIPGRIKALDDSLERESAKLKGMEEEAKKIQLQRKDKEMGLQTKEGTIKKYEIQLYQVKTNKEYTSLEKEIAGIKADNSVLEEEIIKLLDQVDEIQKNITEEKEIIEEQKKKVESEKKNIEGEKNLAQSEFNDLNKKRREFITNVDKGILSKYDRILHKRGHLAVVPTAGDACGGCNMNLPPQVINGVKLKADLIFCENCNRILYTTE